MYDDEWWLLIYHYVSYNGEFMTDGDYSCVVMDYEWWIMMVIIIYNGDYSGDS